MPFTATSPDLLRRFTPTPLVADLTVMGRVVRLETNSRTVLDQAKFHFACYGTTSSGGVDFHWKIVAEESSDGAFAWPELTAFSQDGLSFAGIGHRGFLAVDAKEREAVAFLPEGLARDGPGFGRPFLAMLFLLTSRAVGLTAIPAASVTQGEAGLLIFGPPKCGKTLSSYLAARSGLQFHADQVVFLDGSAASVRAWGEFWAAWFYDGAQAFLPELPAIARQFSYQGQSYLCMEKDQQPGAPRWVVPVACVFLERQNIGIPQMTPLRSEEFKRCLDEFGRLWTTQNLRHRESAVWKLLGRLPAFHLAYGDDPKIPGPSFRDLIESHKR
jgi:hypothetical protein